MVPYLNYMLETCGSTLIMYCGGRAVHEKGMVALTLMAGWIGSYMN
jgi:hypothetical protein